MLTASSTQPGPSSLDSQPRSPVLYLDVAQARADYAAVTAAAGPLRVRYVTKANPHPALLGALAADGAAFAVTTERELDALLTQGVAGARIACVTPGPPASLLRRCRAAGVGHLTVDTVWELQKTAALAPGASVLVALRCSPAGRLRYPAAPLGASLEALDALAAAAHGLPVQLAGVAVHVGSQCERLAPWRPAAPRACSAWAAACRCATDRRCRRRRPFAGPSGQPWPRTSPRRPPRSGWSRGATSPRGRAYWWQRWCIARRVQDGGPASHSTWAATRGCRRPGWASAIPTGCRRRRARAAPGRAGTRPRAWSAASCSGQAAPWTWSTRLRGCRASRPAIACASFGRAPTRPARRRIRCPRRGRSCG